MSPEPPGRSLTFGGPGTGTATQDPVDGFGPAHSARVGRHAPRGRAAARRARERRRSAQRRSRVRKREGSEALLAFLVLLGLTLLLVDLRTDGSAYAGARSIAAGLFGPLQAGTDTVLGAERADAALVAENERLRSELAARAGDRNRLQELEALLGTASRSGQTVIAASVVALDPDIATSLTATIDRGSDDGLAVDQAVLSAGGLAGRVLEVAPGSAVVRLVGDPEFVLGGRLASSGQAGIVRGTGDPGRLTMELLDPLAAVAAGEQVATYGSPGAGPFPPGLAIGAVVDTGDPGSPRRILRLSPAADLTGLSVVAVVVPPAQRAPAAPVAP